MPDVGCCFRQTCYRSCNLRSFMSGQTERTGAKPVFGNLWQKRLAFIVLHFLSCRKLVAVSGADTYESPPLYYLHMHSFPFADRHCPRKSLAGTSPVCHLHIYCNPCLCARVTSFHSFLMVSVELGILFAEQLCNSMHQKRHFLRFSSSPFNYSAGIVLNDYEIFGYL